MKRAILTATGALAALVILTACGGQGKADPKSIAGQRQARAAQATSAALAAPETTPRPTDSPTPVLEATAAPVEAPAAQPRAQAQLAGAGDDLGQDDLGQDDLGQLVGFVENAAPYGVLCALQLAFMAIGTARSSAERRLILLTLIAGTAAAAAALGIASGSAGGFIGALMVIVFGVLAGAFALGAATAPAAARGVRHG